MENSEEAEDLDALVRRWKYAIETTNQEEISQVYDQLVARADEFSFAFMKQVNVGDLLKDSEAVLDGPKFNEMRKTLRKAFKVRKQEAKDDRKRKKKESSSGGDDNDDVKPKKPRVKPEKVEETAEKMKLELAKNYANGIKVMPLDVLALTLGYKNFRSDAVAEARKKLKSEGVVAIGKGTVEFTEKGVEENVTETELPDDPKAQLNMYWTQFESAMKNHKKGKGAKSLEAGRKVWDLLKDGEGHDMQEVLAVTGYAGENSGAIEALKQCLRNLDLAHKENKELKFSEKVRKLL